MTRRIEDQVFERNHLKGLPPKLSPVHMKPGARAPGSVSRRIIVCTRCGANFFHGDPGTKSRVNSVIGRCKEHAK